MTDQSLLMINKQILKLALQQDDLNAVLGSMLSTAECLSNRFGIKPKESFFDSYNLYGSGNTKSEEDLKSQLEIQTKVFRNNHNYMHKKEGKYPFPENLGKKKIENIIKYWKENSKPQNKIYFDNIIKVLNGDYKLEYPETYDNSGELNPKVALEVIPKVMKNVNISRKKVKEEVSKTGVYNNNLKLKGKSEYQNPANPAKTHNETSHMENEKMILIQNFFKIFKKIECYIYIIYLRQNQKISPNFKFGYKEEYDKISDKNISFIIANLSKDINELKNSYEEYCLYNGISKDNEIIEYKKCCNDWFKAFPNDYYIKMLNDILCL